MLVPNSVERQSTCLLEVDAIASDILNRKEVKGKLLRLFIFSPQTFCLLLFLRNVNG